MSSLGDRIISISFFHALEESFWEKILGSWENNVYLQLNTENKLLLILN